MSAGFRRRNANRAKDAVPHSNFQMTRNSSPATSSSTDDSDTRFSPFASLTMALAATKVTT